MAFSNTVLGRTKMGNFDVEIGTFTNDTTEGGEVVTGLSMVVAFFIQPTGSAVNSNEASVNETLPLGKGTVSVVTDSDAETYSYTAIGTL